jgi:hypothetical protein
MPRRVQAAPHLGQVLQADARGDIGDHAPVKATLDEWRLSARTEREARAHGQASLAPDGAAQPLKLNDFQADFLAFTHAMRQIGLPADHP